MYVRHDCLREVGTLRTDVFAQGYGEENDWSLRARHLGWRHVAALDVFVAHVGGRSFGSGKAALSKRNGDILNRLHPGYDALIREFIKQDPIGPVRRRIDRKRWAEGRTGAAVVLITHDLGGGVERHVEERSAVLRLQGLRPIVLRPGSLSPDDRNAVCRISDGTEDDYPNLQFSMSAELEELLGLLRGEMVRWVEIHHVLGHAPDMTRLPDLLGVPYELFVHDAALICPRVTLCGRSGHYCGEPMDIEECELCVIDLGRHDRRAGSVTELRQDSQALLLGARRIVAPCEDAARRIMRYFGPLAIDRAPWEDDRSLAARVGTARRTSGQRLRPELTRICITGAIGVQKGYRVLLACARDAARNDTPISFVVVGNTMDDGPLLETGRVFVTGRFEQDEASDLIRAQDADLGWIPSVGPETWCYALSSLWQAGLPVAAFDIGAQRDRIRSSGKGVLLPIGMRAAQVNQILLRYASESASA
jgi:glycosyltransferase involved in cell wall biosynthesis